MIRFPKQITFVTGATIAMAAAALVQSRLEAQTRKPAPKEAAGAKATDAAEKPLTMGDIGKLRHQRLTPDQIMEKAGERGTAFKLTPAIKYQLRHLGFSAEQIDALDHLQGPQAKEGQAGQGENGAKGGPAGQGGQAGPQGPIVPGQGLKTTDAQRDGIYELIKKITKASGANVAPVAAQHTTLWASKEDQAAYLADIKALEKLLETRCKEPLRSGLDKRSAHIILLKTRYDYEKWIEEMFVEMPDAFTDPQNPGGTEELKKSLIKASGYVSENFAVYCMEGQETEWIRRLAATGFGYMNFVQQIEPQRADPLATGFANAMESFLLGSPGVMIFSNAYGNEGRNLGAEPRAWLRMVQERIRAKQVSTVSQLFAMNMTNMTLPHYAEAWTLVSVLSKQPDKFAALVLELRETKDVLEAISKVYGWDENKLTEEWHKAVLAQR